MAKRQKSIRISERGQEKLSWLARIYGKETTVWELALDQLYEKEKEKTVRAKLKNLLTGEVIEVYSTTDSPDSSYGLECWVDNDGNSYGQCQFGAPFGFALLEINNET